MSIPQGLRVDPDAGSYRGYQQDQAFEHDLGLVVLPVASYTSGSPGAHRVIRLHGGLAMRRVTWRSTRVGVPPMIPAAADSGNDTILSAVVIPSLPMPDKANGAYSWTVQGEYTYVQGTPRVAGVNAFPCGQHPYLVLPQADLAGALVEGQPALPTGATDTFPLDRCTEYATDRATRREDGSIIWPLLALPACLSSTHIIGG